MNAQAARRTSRLHVQAKQVCKTDSPLDFDKVADVLWKKFVFQQTDKRSLK
jgi:hypothetical protein